MEELILVGIMFVVWIVQTLYKQFGPDGEDEEWLESQDFFGDDTDPQSDIDKKIEAYKTRHGGELPAENLVKEKAIVETNLPFERLVQSTPSETVTITKDDEYYQHHFDDKQTNSLATRMARNEGSMSLAKVKKTRRRKVKVDIRQAMLHKIILSKPKALQ